MKLPNIYLYKDYRPFFQDFLAENRAFNPKLSQRFFSHQLHWPVSLMSDLISQRKKLTVTRCLEFCRFANFNEQQIIYFTLLCVSGLTDGNPKTLIDNSVLPYLTHHQDLQALPPLISPEGDNFFS